MKSVIQIYLDIGKKHVFAQVMSKEGFDERKKWDLEEELKLDNIVDGTERIYEFDIPRLKLVADFFSQIVKPNSEYRSGEPLELVREDGIYGYSFPFLPEFYEQLTKQIQEKLVKK